jgi:hypothetical protein
MDSGITAYVGQMVKYKQSSHRSDWRNLNSRTTAELVEI